MTYLKVCARCEYEFESEKDSATYCSDACKMQAYRQRKVKLQEQENIRAARNAMIERDRIRMEQNKAEADKLFLEFEAREQERIKVKLEKSILEQQEHKNKLDKMREVMIKKREKDMYQVERKGDLIVLLGLGLIGGLNLVSESLNKQSTKAITINNPDKNPLL